LRQTTWLVVQCSVDFLTLPAIARYSADGSDRCSLHSFAPGSLPRWSITDYDY